MLPVFQDALIQKWEHTITKVIKKEQTARLDMENKLVTLIENSCERLEEKEELTPTQATPNPVTSWSPERQLRRPPIAELSSAFARADPETAHTDYNSSLRRPSHTDTM